MPDILTPATDLADLVDLAARSSIGCLLDEVEERGWADLTFLSNPSGDNTGDYVGARDADMPAYMVFRKTDGTLRHFYSVDPGQDPHGAPDMNPLRILLDTTPEGRGTDWYPELDD